jgi:hypothetical protein
MDDESLWSGFSPSCHERGKPISLGLNIGRDSELESIGDESPSKQLCKEFIIHSARALEPREDSFTSCDDFQWDLGDDFSEEGSVNELQHATFSGASPSLRSHLESVIEVNSSLFTVDDTTSDSCSYMPLTKISQAYICTSCYSSPGQAGHAQAQRHVDTEQDAQWHSDSSAGEMEVIDLDAYQGQTFHSAQFKVSLQDVDAPELMPISSGEIGNVFRGPESESEFFDAFFDVVET